MLIAMNYVIRKMVLMHTNKQKRKEKKTVKPKFEMLKVITE
jgi:hypothetical protein